MDLVERGGGGLVVVGRVVSGRVVVGWRMWG